ncbi:MAG: hypothetical protein A3D95_13570 [Betaproteobacteria bacterium RIFCSPHIGHO2_12_FULL_69_13]|nr:MAG: hypothetical protein A3D95_13570 [Betaproteobacteria bacterium RIFCSPHIGHO2_12_FULL_69_13]OGA67316.1 MAG: hypothetical protein A3G83_15795 [Betaproteobacteria bacterium RIFCSPLOWO2_12_FULL_68_20]
MPRKFFRKYLPDAHSVRSHRLVAKFGAWLHHPNLWHLNRDSVAGAVAVGLFAGLVPGPLQMLAALILVVIWKKNLPVALIVTFYTNPFTIVPLYVLAYEYGKLLLGGNRYAAAIQPFHTDWSDLVHSMRALLDWSLALGKPLAVGLPALAVTLAVIGYFAVLLAWRAYVTLAWRARRKRRMRKS